MGHSTCGESSCRLSSCLLWGPRKEFTPLCPNCCLATRGERKFSILSQTWEKVEALSPFGHNTIQLFIFPVVITHTGNFCCYKSFLHSLVPFLHKDQSCQTTLCPNVLVLSVLGRNCCKFCSLEIIWAAAPLQSPTRGEALNLLWISAGWLTPGIFSCAYCASAGDTVAKEIIQGNLKRMHALKWYERRQLVWAYLSTAQLPSHTPWCSPPNTTTQSARTVREK